MTKETIEKAEVLPTTNELITTFGDSYPIGRTEEGSDEWTLVTASNKSYIPNNSGDPVDSGKTEYSEVYPQIATGIGPDGFSKNRVWYMDGGRLYHVPPTLRRRVGHLATSGPQIHDISAVSLRSNWPQNPELVEDVVARVRANVNNK